MVHTKGGGSPRRGTSPQTGNREHKERLTVLDRFPVLVFDMMRFQIGRQRFLAGRLGYTVRRRGRHGGQGSSGREGQRGPSG